MKKFKRKVYYSWRYPNQSPFTAAFEAGATIVWSTKQKTINAYMRGAKSWTPPLKKSDIIVYRIIIEDAV